MNLVEQNLRKSGTRAKRAPKRATKVGAFLARNQHGQLSIFFAITLVLLLTITAFIINVGLYVKAKINLQNAVDAAAWSGAAVQARQITDIGYLNWEMRNVYKEWMFKYYILGQLSLPQVKDTTANPRNPMDFYMQKFGQTGTAGDDPYPFPSICMDFSSNSNICRIYEVPGLPKFTAAGHVGTDQTSQALQDVIASKKGKDCTNRTMINLQTALLWAFSPEPLALPGAWPQVAAERIGAFPAALELAMRIRNLERIVNEPPITVCSDTSMGGCTNYDTWVQSEAGPQKERTTKAYWAAVRNLGNSADSEMARSFKMQELSPKVPNLGPPESLSHLLIPDGKMYDKYYLDLKLYLINLVTFYTAFVSNQKTAPGEIDQEASCGATKIGLPIPGYPLGFEKSQEVMTYYAIKGEVKFKGLLNPFADSLPHLTAYAAAKPFGGRIGPKLFGAVTEPGETLVHLRAGSSPRSHNYVFGLDLYPRKNGKGSCDFLAGDAIPFNCPTSTFWVNTPGFAGGIGGWTSGANTLFVLPSLVYEFLQTMPDSSPTPLKIIDQRPGNVIPKNGLFDPEQFKLFRKNLTKVGNIDSNDITTAINNVRAPTRYDALNYLIPTDSTSVDTVPQVVGGSYKIYAPFWGAESYILYSGAVQAGTVVQKFLEANGSALDTFIKAMEKVGDSIRNSGTGTNDQAIYIDAADKMYKASGNTLLCGNVAGDFASFYLGKTTLQRSNVWPSPGCPPTFMDNLRGAWMKKTAGDSVFYYGNLSYNSNADIGFPNPEGFLTAWIPGTRQGAKDDGTIVHPFISGGGANATVLSKRNYYSTKLISVYSVKSPDADTYVNSGFARYTEGLYSSKLGTEGILLNPISDTLPRIKQ